MSNREYRVDGKVAIVTGAGRGIGKAIAILLAEAGADVTVVARTVEQIEQTAVEVRRFGRKVLAIRADITQEDQVKRVVEQTISQFGSIDILCNNAGFLVPQPVTTIAAGVKLPGWQVVEDTQGRPQSWGKPLTLDDWHKVMDTNLTSAFLFAKAAGPYMTKQKKGKVINASSVAADEGTPYFSAYCASKAGLSAFTRCLASEWAPFNINVNAVAPGFVDTQLAAPFIKTPEMRQGMLDLIPFGRFATPRDVALLVLFLASEASDYITGQVFTIDGGAMARGPGI